MGMTLEFVETLPGQKPEIFLDVDPHSSERLSCSLEKMFGAIHFLLTGTMMEGDPPLSFIYHGGVPIGEDHGCGQARRFGPREAARISMALEELSNEVLLDRFDAAKMTELEIYPWVWDEPEEDLKEELEFYLDDMKKFFADVKQRQNGFDLFIC